MNPKVRRSTYLADYTKPSCFYGNNSCNILLSEIERAADQYQFQYPTGVAVDSGGQVYIVGAAASTVMKFTSDGKFITKWGSSGSSQFNSIVGVAADR